MARVELILELDVLFAKAHSAAVDHACALLAPTERTVTCASAVAEAMLCALRKRRCPRS